MGLRAVLVRTSFSNPSLPPSFSLTRYGMIYQGQFRQVFHAPFTVERELFQMTQRFDLNCF